MLLTRNEAADRLRVHVGTLDRYIKAGHITASKNPGPNGSIRISEAEIEAYLARQAVTTEPS